MSICFGISALALASFGCATVPPQAVLVSRGIGTDLAAVQVTYRTLIRVHFQDQRDRINTFIDTRWKPAYLREYIQRGQLVQMATASDPSEVLAGVQDWVTIAFEEIDAKRDALLAPVNRQEDSLLMATDEAFAQVMRANATITAQLESLRHVQEAQNEALRQAGLKPLRDRIDAALVNVSERTQGAIDELEKDRKRLEASIPQRRSAHH